MKTKPKKTKPGPDAPVHVVSIMLAFSNVVADMKIMTKSVDVLAKRLDRAMRNGTTGHGKPK